MAKRKRVTRRGPSTEAPDLQTQLETILDQVWKCEADWRLDNRIALAVTLSRGVDLAC
jgi:hypothetical protein